MQSQKNKKSSITQSVYLTLLSHLQKFQSMKQDERLVFLRDCYTFFGSNFMKALSSIQYMPNKISLTEYTMFYVMIVQKKRFILFKDRQNLKDPELNKLFKFDIQCNCQQSFKRKIQKKAPFLCMHQILFYLIKAMKPQDIKVDKGFEENRDDLGEILLFLK